MIKIVIQYLIDLHSQIRDEKYLIGLELQNVDATNNRNIDDNTNTNIVENDSEEEQEVFDEGAGVEAVEAQ